MADKERIGRFDQVKIITADNVNYLSAPIDVKASPDGIWSVTAVVNGSELLCVQRNIIIKIPAADVFKVVEYDLSNITKKLGKLSHGEK